MNKNNNNNIDAPAEINTNFLDVRLLYMNLKKENWKKALNEFEVNKFVNKIHDILYNYIKYSMIATNLKKLSYIKKKIMDHDRFIKFY